MDQKQEKRREDVRLVQAPQRTFAIDEELMNKVLGYLGEQPYVKVAGIISELMQAIVKSGAPVPVPKKGAEVN